MKGGSDGGYYRGKEGVIGGREGEWRKGERAEGCMEGDTKGASGMVLQI